MFNDNDNDNDVLIEQIRSLIKEELKNIKAESAKKDRVISKLIADNQELLADNQSRGVFIAGVIADNLAKGAEILEQDRKIDSLLSIVEQLKDRLLVSRMDFDELKSEVNVFEEQQKEEDEATMKEMHELMSRFMKIVQSQSPVVSTVPVSEPKLTQQTPVRTRSPSPSRSTSPVTFFHATSQDSAEFSPHISPDSAKYSNNLLDDLAKYKSTLNRLKK